MSAPLVIAGGGLAAQRCCEALRAAGDERPIVLVGGEPHRPYDRPPLSKGLLAGTEDEPAFRPAEWYAEHGVELRLGRRATGLDPVRRRLALEGGETVAYGMLLVATGADAIALPGLAGPGVTTLRTRDDSAALARAIAGGGPLAVLGAGLVGLEVAATARSLGAEVELVEAQPLPLHGILAEPAGRWLAALHRRNGVRLHLGARAARVHRDGAGNVGELVLDDGARIACAHVLVAVGARPSVGWLAGSGIDPGRADALGRTSDPHVLAAGDAVRAGHWEAAARAGAAVAAGLLGRAAPPPAPASFWSDQHGVRLTCVGEPHGCEAGEPRDDGESFELDHLREGRLSAVLLANRPPKALRAARARLTPTPERIAA